MDNNKHTKERYNIMALIKCPECGKEISDKANKCPECGYPVRQNTSKKKWLIIAIITCVLIAIGCAIFFAAKVIHNKPSNSISKSTSNNKQTTQTQTPELAQREGTQFRNAKWGDSIDIVRGNETAEFYGESEQTLIYKDSIEGTNCYVLYMFDGSHGLYRGAYQLNPEYTSGGQYISLYNSLKNKLISKYGEPTTDKIVNNEQQNLIDIAGAPKALEYGYTTYAAQWITTDTKIGLTASAQNYEITSGIIYEEKDYTPSTSGEGL